MKNESSQSGWWGKGAAVFVVLAFGGLAAVPYLIAATKGVAVDGKVSMDQVVKDAEGEMRKGQEIELRSAAWSSDGRLYVGGKGGLAILKEGKLSEVAGFPRDEVKSVACTPDGSVWVAGKKGIYTMKNGKWAVDKEGDTHSLSVSQGGAIIAVGKRGIYSRDTSGRWSELKTPAPETKDEDHEKEDYEKKERGREGRENHDKDHH